MNERAVTTLFRKFLESHPPASTSTYELKYVDADKNKPFSFDQVKEHQVAGLLASLNGLGYKISDSPIYSGMKSRFTGEKPFDLLWIAAYQAFVVVVFYSARRYKKAYMIPVKRFMELRREWPRKSIRELELADQQGVTVIYL